METVIREGDIESLVRAQKDKGRPIETDIIREDKKLIFYDTQKNGYVNIKEVVEQ